MQPQPAFTIADVETVTEFFPSSPDRLYPIRQLRTEDGLLHTIHTTDSGGKTTMSLPAA